MSLTMENSGAALLAGAAQPSSRLCRVRVLRAFIFAGSPVPVDDEVDLPRAFAQEMVSAGKANMLPPLAPADAAADPPDAAVPDAAEPAAPAVAGRARSHGSAAKA